ncbi:bifunctional tetrahydrofolate synthase/dihydrofolate synthase [Nitrincola sp. MINF-07-Sa-05]|uniref:bifunctional tetrahydrofolate synthase/dihydrofolate synthase n=1 Tax=Nitrincola salilacus TaxID=3400273 RepID=UPI0039181809
MSTTYPATLADWLARIEACHPNEIDLGLERIGRVAARLPADLSGSIKIVVGGTNGKGSTTTMLDQILRQAGLSCATFTSPHFLRYNERICIDGEEVSDQALCDAFAAIEQARGDISLTYFEYGALAALVLFTAAKPDVVILEVGLGGRLDAVNLVDADISIVTTIALDHTDWLGPDRESIGREKAGIFRAGKPALCGDIDPPESLLQVARDLGARLLVRQKDYSACSNSVCSNNAQADSDLARSDHAKSAQNWDWQGVSSSGEPLTLCDLPKPALPIENAASVLQAIQFLPFTISEAAIRKGLESAQMTGRMQRLDVQGIPFILDVAHNPEAAAYLAERLGSEDATRTHLIIGMLADKDIDQVLALLQSAVCEWYPITLDVGRGARSEDLAKRLSRLQVNAASIHEHGSVESAVQKVLERVQKGDRVVIAGSFFTVADALKTLKWTS